MFIYFLYSGPKFSIRLFLIFYLLEKITITSYPSKVPWLLFGHWVPKYGPFVSRFGPFVFRKGTVVYVWSLESRVLHSGFL